MKTPRCKKCGKRLTDALSIAAGMGPECRGESGHTHAHAHNQRCSHGHAYAMPACSADLPALFAAGRDARTKEPIQFTRQPDGRYLSSAGANLDADRLYSWLKRFGVSISIVAPIPAGEAYPEVR